MIIAALPFALACVSMKNKPDKKPNMTAGIHKGSFKDSIISLSKNK
jgi:hypothetical protein